MWFLLVSISNRLCGDVGLSYLRSRKDILAETGSSATTHNPSCPLWSSVSDNQCQRAFVLTSALHLPYFKMPLSRKKYLCGEKGVQWEHEMLPEWRATPLTANLKSLLWQSDHYRICLLLMHVINLSAVRCFSSQALVFHFVCLY